MVAGPGITNTGGKRGTTLNPITTVDITVDSAAADIRSGIVLNDYDYATDSVGGDTVDTIAERLVALVNGDDLETATATDLTGGVLQLGEDFLGGIRSLSIYGSLSASNVVRSADNVLVTEGTQTMLVNVQAYSTGRSPRSGAWGVIQQCLAAFQTEDMVETLRAQGVGIGNKTQPIDLSAIAGANWESRVSADITLTARAAWVRPVDIIETVDETIVAKGPTGDTLATETLSVSAP
jgi:hypothetical protein